MEPFCTVEQYTARVGAVDDEGILEECLSDATATIAAILDARGIDYTEPSEDYADRLMRVCRSMANRIMPSSTIPGGATQASITGGPYSQGWTFAAPYGTPKPLASELKLLGITSGGLTSVPAAIDGYYGSNND